MYVLWIRLTKKKCSINKLQCTFFIADFYNISPSWNDTIFPEDFLCSNCTTGTYFEDITNNTLFNLTSNITLLAEEEEELAHLILMGILSVFLGLMILVTVIGKHYNFNTKSILTLKYS